MTSNHRSDGSRTTSAEVARERRYIGGEQEVFMNMFSEIRETLEKQKQFLLENERIINKMEAAILNDEIIYQEDKNELFR